MYVVVERGGGHAIIAGVGVELIAADLGVAGLRVGAGLAAVRAPDRPQRSAVPGGPRRDRPLLRTHLVYTATQKNKLQ